jgi:hypothetical protein
MTFDDLESVRLLGLYEAFDETVLGEQNGKCRFG